MLADPAYDNSFHLQNPPLPAVPFCYYFWIIDAILKYILYLEPPSSNLFGVEALQKKGERAMVTELMISDKAVIIDMNIKGPLKCRFIQLWLVRVFDNLVARMNKM